MYKFKESRFSFPNDCDAFQYLFVLPNFFQILLTQLTGLYAAHTLTYLTSKSKHSIPFTLLKTKKMSF